MFYRVKWVIPKNKYFKTRIIGTERVQESCPREAQRWAQICVAQRYRIHAGMVKPFRCYEVAEIAEVA